MTGIRGPRTSSFRARVPHLLRSDAGPDEGASTSAPLPAMPLLLNHFVAHLRRHSHRDTRKYPIRITANAVNAIVIATGNTSHHHFPSQPISLSRRNDYNHRDLGRRRRRRRRRWWCGQQDLGVNFCPIEADIGKRRDEVTVPKLQARSSVVCRGSFVRLRKIALDCPVVTHGERPVSAPPLGTCIPCSFTFGLTRRTD